MQYEDLQGAIVVAPEFRDLQRFIRLQGSGGRHIDLKHEVRGWVHCQVDPVFPYHRSLTPKYAGTCRDIPLDDAMRRRSAGEPAVVRLRVPANRDVVFDDLVRGTVTFHTDQIGDPVLVRSDGIPAYNYAVVIDDQLMAITHVIRGEDHISNTPRQVLVYEAFGWTPPAFAHLSLVLGPDHAPLSKRHGATSVAEFREKGYLPEALVNYLALIGWSPRSSKFKVQSAKLEARIRPRSCCRPRARAALPARGRVAQRRRVRRGQAGWVNRHYLKSDAARSSGRRGPAVPA